MEFLATDLDRLAFLLETDASLDLDLLAEAGELVTEELPEVERPKYNTNYIGSKQEFVDWIWKHTPDDVASVRICQEELEALPAGNAKVRTFACDNFKRIFFAEGLHGVTDQIRASADSLEGYKRSIALFALGKTCMSGKGGFAHFASSADYSEW